MSRIGRKPVELPKGVTCQVAAGRVEIKGPRGAMVTPLPEGISVKAESAHVVVDRALDDKPHRARHGMVRSLLHSAVAGVTEGWKKDLEIVGIGYKAALEGKSVTFNLGYSHPIEFPVPEGIKIVVDPKQTKLSITGNDKQQVGQVAAQIRALRPPEPYKGKGIKYADEIIKKKVGKTGA